MQVRVLAFVLAGGKGTRLFPLTKERAKPAAPFGGRYRIVDFVLSNLVNSGIYSIYVLIQFKSQSLLQHLSEGWEVGGLLQQHFIIPVPAQMRSPTGAAIAVQPKIRPSEWLGTSSSGVVTFDGEVAGQLPFSIGFRTRLGGIGSFFFSASRSSKPLLTGSGWV